MSRTNWPTGSGGLEVGVWWKRLKCIWKHPANQDCRVRAIMRAVLWKINKRTTHRSWTIGVWDGLEFEVFPDSGAGSAVLFFNGLPNYHEMRFMARYLRPGDGFLDVGANVGTYTLYAARLVGERGRVDAFEPGAKARKRLASQIIHNSIRSTHIWPLVVADHTGPVRFSRHQDTLNHIVQGGELGVRAARLTSTSLDDWHDGQSYAMGKMDIEGAEPLALKGAVGMLDGNNPPVWLLEMNELLHRYGHTHESLRDWLASRGFRLAIFDEDKVELRYCPRPWEESQNVLAIAVDAIKFVETRLKVGA